jgi:hypothetical protein
MISIAAGRVTAEREEQIRKETLWRASNAEDTLKKLQEKLEVIKARTGISLDTWTPSQPIIDRLNAASALEVITRNVQAIERSAKALLEDAMEIQAAAGEIRANRTEGEGP